MSSLSACIKKAGKNLFAEDKSAVLEAARVNRQAGMSTLEAAKAAVRSRREEVQALLVAEQKRVSTWTVDASAAAKVAAEPVAVASPVAEPVQAVAAEQAVRRQASGTAKHPKTVMGSEMLARVSMALGGLHPSLLSEYSVRVETGRKDRNGFPTFQWRNPLIPGVGRLFRAGGSSDRSMIANTLQDYDYLPPETVESDYKQAGEQAKEMIRAALNREVVKTRAEIIAEAEAEQDAERTAYYAEVDAEAAREMEAEREAIVAANGLSATDLDALTDDDFDFSATRPDADTETAMRSMGFSEQEIADELAQEAAARQEKAGAAEIGADGTQATRAVAEDRSAAPGADPEELTLEAQDANGLQARAARLAAADKADAAEQKRLADKIKADSERDEFTLTGSDRAVDVGAAAGQGGLFDSAAPPAEPTTQPAQEAEPAKTAATTKPAAQSASPVDAMMGLKGYTQAESEMLTAAGFKPTRAARSIGQWFINKDGRRVEVFKLGGVFFGSLSGSGRDTTRGEDLREVLRDMARVHPAFGITPEAAPSAAEPSTEPTEQRADFMRRGAEGEKAAPAKIGDFGSKLDGARKDYAALMKEAADVDVAAEPLSKSWPEPDYAKLLQGGADPFMVAFIHAARDEVPTKPQKSWKLKGWVDSVQMLRSMAQSMLDGAISPEKMREVIARSQFAQVKRNVGSRAELYQLVGHDKSLKGITFAEHHYSLYRGQENVNKWVVEQPAKATAFSNWPRELAVADTKDEMLAQFKAKIEGLDLGKSAKKQTQFIIYRKRGVEGAFIGKKIGREHIDLKKVADVAEARKYLESNTAELEAALAKYKETPMERNAENQPRVGDDHRNGGAVTPEAFADAFGFRGVQFGNYVEQGRRQSDLNQAYDALMDMAAVLGVPSRALSLNGRLGLAFGARGSGGKGAPAAHFEPGKVVINLTKGSGPGSLAHEWWHALDNYFARESTEGSTDYLTNGAAADKMRNEMRAAFVAVKRATTQRTLMARSKTLDARKSKAYWSAPVEMSARSFESYVIAKLKDQGAANDYLANVVSKEFWDAQEAMRAEALEGGKAGETYPYPTADEAPEVRAAFDEFFRVVETRKDDAGNVALFSRNRRMGAVAPRQLREAVARITADWDQDLADVQVVNRVEDLPADIQQAVRNVGSESTVRGLAMPDGRVYLVAENISTVDEGRFVLFHEVYGHVGMRAFLGDAYAAQMRTLKQANPSLSKEADAWFAQYGEDEIAARVSMGMAPLKARQMVQALAVEEALADRAGNAPELKGWQALMALLQRALRRMRLGSVADMLEGMTQAETLNLLRQARRTVQGEQSVRAQTLQKRPAFSRSYDSMINATGRELAQRAKNTKPEIDAAWRAHARIVASDGVASPDDLAAINRITGFSQWARSPIAGDVDATAALRADIAAAGFPGGVYNAPTVSLQGAISLHGSKLVQYNPEQLSALSSLADKHGVPITVRGFLGNNAETAFQFKRLRDEGFVPYTGITDANGRKGDGLIQYIRPGGGIGQNTPLFSRRQDFTPQPEVATGTTEQGHPEFATAKVSIAFPQVAERFEVIPGQGQEVVSYAIMPPDSFDVLGHVELLVENGRPVSLLDIEVYRDKGRGKGIGRAVIEALLAANPDADLNISNIVPEARGFWEQMGVPQQNVEGAYDGTLNWQTYSANNRAAGRDAPGRGGSRQGRTAEGAGPRASAAGQGQVGPLFSRRTSQDLLNAGGGLHDFKRYGATKQDRIRTVTDKARTFWLGALTRDQIADVYGKDVPQVRDYDRLVRSMENERSSLAQRADDLYQRWAKLDAATNDKLARIMLDATIEQVHPDSADAPVGAAKTSAHAQLRAQFESLPPEAQAMYREVRDFHAGVLADIKNALVGRIKRQVEAGAERAALLSKVQKQFDQYLENGPYFPLSRFGDYLVIAERPDGQRVVAAYENAGEQQAAARELRKDGFTTKMKTAKEYTRSQDGSAGKFIGDVIQAVEKVDMVEATVNGSRSDLKNQLLDDLNQLFIRSLPDLSYRKHFAHRKNTPGFSGDVMRGFASSSFHAASHIARLNHADRMTLGLQSAFEAVDKAAEGDFNTQTQVLNELSQRHEAMLNPNTHPLSALATQVGFVMHLGLSPAAGLINMLQVPMVTIPYLGARHGFAKASAAMAKAYADIMKAPANAQNGFNAAQSLALSAEERRAMSTLQDEGVIDLTQAHDLAAATDRDVGDLARSKTAFAVARAMRIVGWTFHVPEVMNRQTTALMAYRLERDKGADHETALEAARETIKRTQFDYSTSNRARYMQGNVARVVMQFKQFSQNMTYFLGRAAFQALKDESPEVRKIARRQLLSTFLVTGAMAGSLGLPGIGAAMGLVGVLVGAMDDEDEPWDWQTEYRNVLADQFGKDWAEVFAKGVPRMLLPGWDIAGRVSLSDLWWRNNSREGQNPRESFAGDMANILGPTAGTMLSWYVATDHMQRGNYSKAVEAVVPKFIRDPLKAYREGADGITSYNGDPLMDVNGAEVLGRALGFAPARVSEMYEGRNAVMNTKTALEEKRQRLINQAVQARIDGDREAELEARSEIAGFNSRNPDFRITGLTINRSHVMRMRNRANTEQGILLPDTKAGLRERARFANVE